MGLGSLLARPAARPVGGTRTAGATIESVLLDFRNRYGFNPWQASTYRGFLSIPGAWRASVMLSDLFAQMPLHSYRVDSTTGTEIRTPRNAPILDAPAASFEDPSVVFASWGMDYLWDGNMVGIYTGRSAVTGLPVAILPVPVSEVGVRQVLVDDGLGGRTGRKEYDVGGVVFDQADVFHVKGPCAPGALRGLGVLETQLAALTLASDLESQASSITLNGVPTGILKSSNPEEDPGDLATAKAAWIESQRTRTIAALGPNVDFKPLAWNPEEMQLIEARKFSLTQLELMFGLPVGWLGGASPSRTYSNVEQDAVNLVKFSVLAGMVMRTESVFTIKTLPRGQSAKANLDAVLRSDTMNRYKAHQLATGNKAWKTVNEVRGTENLEPIEGGDELATAPAEPPPGVPAVGGADDNSPEGDTQ
jgi:HK97 family phage portal protein